MRNIDFLGFNLFDKWLYNLRENRRISQFFEDNLYQNIAIYGLGKIGRQMCDELEGTNINVCYAIDRAADQIVVENIAVVTPDSITKMEFGHSIVVTPFDQYIEIERTLLGILGNDETDIISINTVIEYISRFGA